MSAQTPPSDAAKAMFSLEIVVKGIRWGACLSCSFVKLRHPQAQAATTTVAVMQAGMYQTKSTPEWTALAANAALNPPTMMVACRSSAAFITVRARRTTCDPGDHQQQDSRNAVFRRDLQVTVFRVRVFLLGVGHVERINKSMRPRTRTGEHSVAKRGDICVPNPPPPAGVVKFFDRVRRQALHPLSDVFVVAAEGERQHHNHTQDSTGNDMSRS